MARAFAQMQQLLGDSCRFRDLWEAGCSALGGCVFWEPPGGLSSSAFSDAELLVLHAVGSGGGFFPGAVVVHCWCGSESAIRDFSPSARCWRSRVANVSHLVRETEKWWKLPLFSSQLAALVLQSKPVPAAW